MLPKGIQEYLQGPVAPTMFTQDDCTSGRPRSRRGELTASGCLPVGAVRELAPVTGVWQTRRPEYDELERQGCGEDSQAGTKELWGSPFRGCPCRECRDISVSKRCPSVTASLK
jgi:hypothetical protein